MAHSVYIYFRRTAHGTDVHLQAFDFHTRNVGAGGDGDGSVLVFAVGLGIGKLKNSVGGVLHTFIAAERNIVAWNGAVERCTRGTGFEEQRLVDEVDDGSVLGSEREGVQKECSRG